MAKSDTFELQTRLLRAWDENLTFSQHGTVFGGFAARAIYEEGNQTVSTAVVECRMTDDRTTGSVKKQQLRPVSCDCHLDMPRPR